MTHVMGVNSELMHASLLAMRIFMIMTIVFPWLDYMNGIIMLRGQTKIMVFSQTANAIVTVLTLFIAISNVPGWNGLIGALAQSVGMLAELTCRVLMYSNEHPKTGKRIFLQKICKEIE